MDEDFMRLAIEEGAKALADGCLPVGVVLVKNEQVLSAAHKQADAYRRHLDHAEIVAIRNYINDNRRLKNVTIYTTLEPCIMCFATMLHLRAMRIVYAVGDPYGGASGLANIEASARNQPGQIEVVRNFLRDEATGLFLEFLSRTNDQFWIERKEFFESHWCSTFG